MSDDEQVNDGRVQSDVRAEEAAAKAAKDKAKDKAADDDKAKPARA